MKTVMFVTSQTILWCKCGISSQQ